VGGDDGFRECDVPRHERLDGLPDLRLVEPAHLGDLERKGLQIGVECPSGMLDHVAIPITSDEDVLPRYSEPRKAGNFCGESR
jgi:hypothetical protein